MHCCGNPLHDAPMWIMFFATFSAPCLCWLRAKLGCKNHIHKGE